MPLIADKPVGIEVTLRENADRRLLFVLNTTDETIDVRNLPAGRDVLTGSIAVDGACSPTSRAMAA